MKKFIGVMMALAMSACGTFAYAQRPGEVPQGYMDSVGELYIKGKVPTIEDTVEYKDAFICTVSKIGEGKFLTAGHCVMDSSGVLYTVKFGSQTLPVTHYTVGVKERAGTEQAKYVDVEDWAIVYTQGDANAPALTMDCKGSAYVGEPLFTIGYPFPAGKSYFQGYVASIEPLRFAGGGTYWGDITAAPGASGSPIFNETGKVSGVLVTGVNSKFGPLLTGIQTVQVAGICG